MTHLKELPNEVLENIRQFIGNCRIYNGEFIMTLDKKSDEFMNMECLIKKRLDNMRFALISMSYDMDGYLREDPPPVSGFTFFGWDEIHTIPWNSSWAVCARWNQDRQGHKYRFIMYKYYSDIDTLYCVYKRRATQSQKKMSNKCMFVDGYITDTGYVNRIEYESRNDAKQDEGSMPSLRSLMKVFGFKPSS